MCLSESVYDRHSFQSEIGHFLFQSSTPISNLDTKVLLKYLQRELKVIVYDEEVIVHS